jgi:hypothetical protein
MIEAEYGKIERIKLKHWFDRMKITNFKFSNEFGFAHFDFWAEHHTGIDTIDIVGEVKVRDFDVNHSFDYENPISWLIEKAKYRHLMSLEADRHLYINFFNNGTVVWVLDKLPEPIWYKKKCNDNTAQGTGKKVWKKVGDLLLSEGKIL